MVDNPVWEICERVAEVQTLLDDHVAGGKHSAAEVVAAVSLDHVVGRCKQGRWDGQAERFRSF